MKAFIKFLSYYISADKDINGIYFELLVVRVQIRIFSNDDFIVYT